MMQTLRPVRAKASKLLSAPIGTNSKVDYQQAHVSPPSGLTFAAAQQSFGEAPASYEVSACHMPVMWPMHTDSNDVSGASCPQVQGSGGMMWIQPVFWPVFSTNDGMQGGVSWDATHQKQQQTVGGTFGLRKQRRSKRNGCQTGTQFASDAAMCPDELEEMRRAVKSTKQALEARNTEQALEARSRDEWSVRLPTKPALAEKHNPSPKTLKQFTSSTSKTTERWADANDEDDEEGEASSLASLDTADSMKVHGCADLQQATTWQEQIENVNPLPEVNCAQEAAMDTALLELDNLDGENFRSTIDWVVSTAWSLALTKKRLPRRTEGHRCGQFKGSEGNR